MPRVTIITPTVGQPVLCDCIASVARQTYRDIEHWIVVDGAERSAPVFDQFAQLKANPAVTVVPRPTGLHNFCGHRIYAAFPFLTDSEWIIYLDEDNWLEPDHVALLVRLAEEHQLDWAYSLRNVVSRNGAFLCRDDCQSLGWWPAYDGGYNLVDTSCYLLKRSLATAFAHLWNRPSYDPHVESPDRALCAHLLRDHPLAFTTGRYSVNYRLGGTRPEDKDHAFFVKGNQIVSTLYKHYPWNSLKLHGRSPTHPTLNMKPSVGS